MPRFSRRANLLKDFKAVAKSCIVKAYIRFYAIAQDWLDDNNLELDEEEELGHPSDVGKIHSQIFAYMLEVH